MASGKLSDNRVAGLYLISSPIFLSHYCNKRMSAGKRHFKDSLTSFSSTTAVQIWIISYILHKLKHLNNNLCIRRCQYVKLSGKYLAPIESRLVLLLCEKVDHARRKIWNKSLKETNVGMSQALFDILKILLDSIADSFVFMISSCAILRPRPH